MPSKKKPKSPLQELADQADQALAICWERLAARELTDDDIQSMVKSWRTKRRAHIEAAELKQERKEERESDNG